MSLWRNRDFNLFWLVQTLSVAGDSVSLIAVPLLVLHATGSVAQMGLLTGLAGAAAIVTGTFAGAIADRVDRRTLLIVCDVARAALFGLVPLIWFIGPQIWLLYVVFPVAAGFGMVFQVTYVTAVPNLVGREQITEANGRLFATQAGAAIGGMVLAGVASGAFGPAAAIGIDAVTFGVSAAGLTFVRLRRSVPARRQSPWLDFATGARFLWHHPVLRALTVMLCFLIFLSIGLTDILIYYLKSDLGQSDTVVGYVMAAGALGTVIGALATGRLRRTLGFGVCWIGGTALCGVAIALTGLTRSVVGVGILVALYACTISVGGICSMTLRQEVTPDHLLGRVTATFWTIQRALSPIGAAALTAATAQVGVTQVLLWTGITCVLIGLTGAFTPIRLARPELIAPSA